MREIVLPSGRFATIRRLTGADLLALPQTASFNTNALTMHLITLAVRIDGEAVTMQDLTAMDLQDVLPLYSEVARLIAGPAEKVTG